MYIDGYWVWCGEANYHDPAAAAARSSKEQSAVSSSVVYTSIMNNMSSLSVCLSVDQSVVGGREEGRREVEVSLFLKYCIVLYWYPRPCSRLFRSSYFPQQP